MRTGFLPADGDALADRFGAGQFGAGAVLETLRRVYRLGARRVVSADLEIGDALLQLLRFVGKFFRCCGNLFGRGGILLGDGIQLLDRLIDLPGADILFAASGADFGYQFGGAADVGETVLAETALISAAAAWLRSASLRTSLATTAKPLPYSPARAASTAAFSASKSVWRAISCTMPILSAMVRMALTAFWTAWPLVSASREDCCTILSVCAALSAFCLMLAAISSIDAEASSVAEACSVEPCDITVAV